MKILKFGGSSVSAPERIKEVIASEMKSDQKLVLVVSALSGATNTLEEICELAKSNQHEELLKKFGDLHFDFVKENFSVKGSSNASLQLQGKLKSLSEICNGIAMLEELSNKSKAKVLSYGENISSLLLSLYLKENEMDFELINATEILKANEDYLSAQVDFKASAKLVQEKFQKVSKAIVPGFVASNENNEVVLLGRGGSDYTATILANCLNAKEVEIWSDVDGMMNAHPRFVKSAVSIPALNYQEAFEMSCFGAKVLYPPAINPVVSKGIPVRLKNTFNLSFNGTQISNENKEDQMVGVSSLSEVVMFNISGIGLKGEKGFAGKLCDIIASEGVNIIFISQACSENSICFVIDLKDGKKIETALKKRFKSELDQGKINPLEIDKNVVIVAVIGDQLKSHIGISGEIFSVLGENGINVKAIAQGSSERNISMVLHKKDEAKALNVLHEKLFLPAVKSIHLFVAGRGNVGKEFLEILKKKQPSLLEEKVNLKLVGLANSKGFSINEEGIEFNNFEIEKEGNILDFVNAIKGLNLRNAIFVDNTASEKVAEIYKECLSNHISVVACNKIGFAQSYQKYQELKSLAKRNHVHLQYETTVGAALPIISTLSMLQQSGDEVLKCEAVLSGSLNFIFNAYDGQKSFSEVVKLALDEGYTEPNPHIDLAGIDVKRKMLILARELGDPMEDEQVELPSYLPNHLDKANDVDQLFQMLSDEENAFQQMYGQAKAVNEKLKIVGKWEKGKVKIDLERIPSDHPFYHLDGKDNIIAIQSKRYPEQPLVIKGAGAGAEVTASGVFADVLKIINEKK